jgi:hypothetical protein
MGRRFWAGALAALLAANGRAAAQGVAPSASPAIPRRLAVTVTGSPASPTFLAGAISDALARSNPGSGVRLATLAPAPEPLDPGFFTTYMAGVTFAEPVAGGEPGTASVTVDVRNAALAPATPGRLAFHDDPERITADGVLSRTTVDAGAPVRLYYYHENSAARRRFCVVLSANGSVMSHVAILGAAAGPNVDVMSVGHVVSKAFLAHDARHEGIVLDVPGGRPVTLIDVLAGPGAGLVGAFNLDVIDGGPLTATVLAVPPAAAPAAYLYGPNLPPDGHERHGVFDLGGFGRIVVAYTSGGAAATHTYGTRAGTPPNVDPAAGGHDYGDYGALQHVTFDLANPYAVPSRVYLYEKPLGGVVRSSFAVNGTIREVGCVRVAQRYLIDAADVPPHAAATLDVVTMTDGGSSYPLEIGVTTDPPLPHAPPISAPDGCFPKRPAAAAPASSPKIDEK